MSLLRRYSALQQHDILFAKLRKITEVKKDTVFSKYFLGICHLIRH